MKEYIYIYLKIILFFL